jgi:hypothetical protein
MDAFTAGLQPRGTSVAPERIGRSEKPSRGREDMVRRTQLAMILMALVVGALAGGVAVARQASIMVQGQVSATEQESDEGYFAVGSDTMIVAKPQSKLHQWLRVHNGQQVRVTIEVDQPTE